MLVSLLSPFFLGADRASALVPAISIPVWDQYVDFIEWALDGLATSLNSGGLAIVVFTIAIKTLIMPLTVQSLRSSKAMQELQPRIKELQKKHGKDRQRLTQETMRLYSENHVNPMSGCLPMLLQIPIFLGLYNAIRHLSDSEQGPWSGDFLWLSNGLHRYDPWYVLPVMAGAFQFVQTRMMRPRNQEKITDPQQAMMNTMMNFMPLTVIVFGWQFASGAVLYWATQSVYSVIQQWFITGWGSMGNWFPWLPELPEHRRLGYRPPRPPQTDPVVMSGDGAHPVRASGPMGWLQKRMEEAERQRAGGATTTTAAGEAEEALVRAEAPARATGGTAAGSRRASSRNGSGRGKPAGAGTGGGAAKTGARTGARNGARTNGTRATADVATGGDGGGGRAVVVPRKARPSAGSNGDG